MPVYIYIYTNLQKYMITRMHACMHACIHAYVRTCMHACMHTYIHVCMRMNITDRLRAVLRFSDPKHPLRPYSRLWAGKGGAALSVLMRLLLGIVFTATKNPLPVPFPGNKPANVVGSSWALQNLYMRADQPFRVRARSRLAAVWFTCRFGGE